MRPGVNFFEPGKQIGIALVETGPRPAGFEREAHHDIGGGKLITGKIGTVRKPVGQMVTDLLVWLETELAVPS